jgi:hypothetical protein
MARLRAGIIGLGVGERHIAGYRGRPDCAVVAVAGNCPPDRSQLRVDTASIQRGIAVSGAEMANINITHNEWNYTIAPNSSKNRSVVPGRFTTQRQALSRRACGMKWFWSCLLHSRAAELY